MQGGRIWLPADCVMHVSSFLSDPNDLRSLGQGCQSLTILTTPEGLGREALVNRLFIRALQTRYNYRELLTHAIIGRISVEIKAWCQANSLPEPSNEKIERIRKVVLQKDHIDALLARHAAMCVKLYDSKECILQFFGTNPKPMPQVLQSCLPIYQEVIRTHKEGWSAILASPEPDGAELKVDELTVKELRSSNNSECKQVVVKRGISDGKKSVAVLVCSDFVCSFLDPKSLTRWLSTCHYANGKKRMMNEFCQRMHYGVRVAEQLTAQFLVLRPRITLDKILRIRDLLAIGSDSIDKAFTDACVRFLSVDTIRAMWKESFSPRVKAINQKEFLKQLHTASLIHQHLMQHLEAVKAIAREPNPIPLQR